MGRLLGYVLVFINFGYNERGNSLNHHISLNKLQSICAGGEPFKDYEFDKTLANVQNLLYQKFTWEGLRDRCAMVLVSQTLHMRGIIP